MNHPIRFKLVVFFLSSITLFSCANPEKKRAANLYKMHCASCHVLPNIQDLPKDIWKNGVLPDMAARMGIRDSAINPFKNKSFKEQNAILKTGIYPNKPQITLEDWQTLSNYIISLAPDSLIPNKQPVKDSELTQFTASSVQLDQNEGTFTSFLAFDENEHAIITGDLQGKLIKYNPELKTTESLAAVRETITDYTIIGNTKYITKVGYLDPSEIPSGTVEIISDSIGKIIPMSLHRPVHTLVHDFDLDGNYELVVSEFGNLTGSLSLIQKNDDTIFNKKTLLNLPGTIRSLAKDMNKDGKDDIVVLTSQGNEGITILYQKEDLNFEAETVIRFNPVWGSSWFELIDYNGDGYEDIVTVHGDNADKSYVQKPYHGLRIHINNGENEFKEVFFFPLNGATRVIAKDFDQDNDLDFAIIATFPDYQNNPNRSFLYLENKNANLYDFSAFTLQESTLGRWLLMDSGDVDNDGDEDLILSSFTYSFTPVPEKTSKIWQTSNTDLLILKNNLIE